MRNVDIPIGELLLDPNNYRFAELEGFVSAAEARFGEEGVQRRTMERLRRDESLVDLKRSLLRNGFIPLERIVVRPYPAANGEHRYLVIEGNRRTAAAKWIVEDNDAGVEVPEGILRSIRTLPCMLIEEQEQNEVFRASLMGIRHVSGVRQWGGYQRAKLVAHMKDELELETSEISERLGMSANEVNRRYRAFKALEQMQDDEEFGDYALPALYPIFHEAVSLPVVREWLGWDGANNRFTNAEHLSLFYSILTPGEDEEGHPIEAKISTYSNVRDLRAVLSNGEARTLLFQPHATLAQALALVERQQFAGSWFRQVTEASAALENLGVQQVRLLTEEERRTLQQLGQLITDRLRDYEQLNRP